MEDSFAQLNLMQIKLSLNVELPIIYIEAYYYPLTRYMKKYQKSEIVYFFIKNTL